jgi:hypothetical protein
MDISGIEHRLVEQWQRAAVELNIRVTAPIELRDTAGQPFTCEAFVHDFGSTNGAVVVSPRTGRRVRARISEELWVSGSERRLAGYSSSHFIDQLLDWGWFGNIGAEPAWYAERVPR